MATGRPKAARSDKMIFRKPPPEGVVEVVGVLGHPDGLVELRDGTLLSSAGRTSRDGGVTWTRPRSFGRGMRDLGVQRMRSGKLTLCDSKQLWLSRDDGKTWGKPRAIRTMGITGGDQLVELSTGRLLLPSRTVFVNKNHVGLTYLDDSAYGLWRGERVQIEGHGHMPEIAIASVSRSDDEGRTWHAGKPGEDERGMNITSATLMGWFGFDGSPTCGDGWVTDCDEPAVAETSTGAVLCFARSTVGRIVESFSLDGGMTWTPVAPSDLAGSYSPARLVRIPSTGDLMCVWNQVSHEEIRRGYRRGRLSAAISKDGGHSWENFKTLELSEGLDDVDRVPTEPIRMVVRSRKNVVLPDKWAFFHYVNVSFARDKAYVSYNRSSPLLGIAEHNFDKQEKVLRIYPLEYFYS